MKQMCETLFETFFEVLFELPFERLGELQREGFDV